MSPTNEVRQIARELGMPRKHKSSIYISMRKFPKISEDF